MASLIRNPLDCYCQLVQLTRGERALSSHCSGTFSHIVSSENPLSRALQYLFRIARRQDAREVSVHGCWLRLPSHVVLFAVFMWPEPKQTLV